MSRNAYLKSHHKMLLTIFSLILAIVMLIGAVQAFLSDHSSAIDTEGYAGTVTVTIIEAPPFDTSNQIEFIDQKTFRGKSLGTLDTYLRAYLKPIVEAYDEQMGKWILIPISNANIKLEVTQDSTASWIGTDAQSITVNNLSEAKYFYYYKPLTQGEETTDLKVQIIDIDMPKQFLNMEIRYNLHVFLEGAQVKSDLWRIVYDITRLPVGVGG